MASTPCCKYDAEPVLSGGIIGNMKIAKQKGLFIMRREFTIKFMETLHPVAERIMSCFAVGLGFPEDFFTEVRCVGLLQ